MIEDIRKTALAHAMELSRSCGMREASDIIKDASVFEAYLTGAVSVDGGSPSLSECKKSIDGIGDELCIGRGKAKVNAGLEHPPRFVLFGGKKYRLSQSNVYDPVGSLTMTYDAVREDDRGSATSNFVNSFSNPDEQLVGGFAHRNFSSQKENTSGPELPTPGSTETVIPGGGAVTEPGTHGRTDGGA